jgi:hypothetical protein
MIRPKRKGHDAGVIDQYINCAKVFDTRLSHCVHLCGIGDVSGARMNGASLRTQVLTEGGNSVAIDIDGENVRPA